MSIWLEHAPTGAWDAHMVIDRIVEPLAEREQEQDFLASRTALVTGAGRRIGRALAVALVLGLAAGFTLWWGCYGAGRVSWWGLLVGALLVWNIHVGWWLIRAAHWTEADHEGGMYRALVLWAVVDIGLAVVWLRG